MSPDLRVPHAAWNVPDVSIKRSRTRLMVHHRPGVSGVSHRGVSDWSVSSSLSVLSGSPSRGALLFVSLKIKVMFY